jgi:cytochrome c oxidase subunit II
VADDPVTSAYVGSPGGGGAPGPRTPHIRRVLLIWAGVSVIGIALTLLIVPLVTPVAGSSVAGFANLTDLVFTVLAVPVAAFVWVFVFYSLVAFRQKAPTSARGDQLEDGPPLEAKPWHQILWLAVTGTLALFLVGWGMFGFYRQTTDPPRDPLVVDVTGQQWLWTYFYPSQRVRSNVLVLPLGRPVEFLVTSDDVLHGFQIDGLGVTIDANPGQWVSAPVITPTRLGDYTVRCVELCGLYHTYMWSRVKVVPAASFAAWAAATRGLATASGPAGTR